MITVLSDKAIAIHVPDYPKHLCPYIGDIRNSLMYWGGHDLQELQEQPLPDGNWEILGRPEEMNVEQCAMVMGDDERSLYLLLVEKKLDDKSIIILIKKQ